MQNNNNNFEIMQYQIKNKVMQGKCFYFRRS